MFAAPGGLLEAVALAPGPTANGEKKDGAKLCPMLTGPVAEEELGLAESPPPNDASGFMGAVYFASCLTMTTAAITPPAMSSQGSAFCSVAATVGATTAGVVPGWPGKPAG